MALDEVGDIVLGGKGGTIWGERLLSRLDRQSVWNEDLFLRLDEM